MAILGNKLWPTIDDVTSVPGHSFTGITDNKGWTTSVQPLDTIQGQMITATMEIDEMQQTVMADIDIKSRLLNALALELLSAKCIEFTKQHDVARNTIKVRARIYATPDSQVRIIRQAIK